MHLNLDFREIKTPPRIFSEMTFLQTNQLITMS